MSASVEFAHRQEAASRSIAKEADTLLKTFLPRLEKKAVSMFRQDVIKPAIALASRIRCSTSSYNLDITRKSGCLNRNDLNRFQVRNARSGKMLKADQTLFVTNAGAIGESILMVQPALYRRRKAAEDILLKKAIVLAKVFEPTGAQIGK